MAGYVDWPEGTSFRVFVNPAKCKLAYPVQFYSRADFIRFVVAIVTAYVATQRDQRDALAPEPNAPKRK